MRFLTIPILLVLTLAAASAQPIAQANLLVSTIQDTMDAVGVVGVVPVNAHAYGAGGLFGNLSVLERPNLTQEQWTVLWNATMKVLTPVFADYEDVKEVAAKLDDKVRKAIKDGVQSSNIWAMVDDADQELAKHPKIDEILAKLINVARAEMADQLGTAKPVTSMSSSIYVSATGVLITASAVFHVMS